MKKFLFVLTAVFVSLTSCGKENDIIWSESSESEPQTSCCEEIVYTDKDVYIDSFNCGYLSQEQKPERYEVYVIETDEQLEYAKENLGVGYPTDYNPDDYWYYNTMLVDGFEKMENACPFSEYCYVIEYEEVNSTGYYFHADKVAVKENNRICFKHDDKSHCPYDDEECGDAMDGFFHMCAMPREYLNGLELNNK